MTTIKIDNMVIPVQRKNIKNLYLRISMIDGSLKVTAPIQMPLTDIRTYISEKKDWIDLQMDKVPANAGRGLAIDLPHDAAAQLTTRLEPMIPLCEELVGSHANGYRLKDMQSRWGSCSMRTGIISLNLHLLNYDDACLRYVLIHELIHFYVPNHGPAFYYFMREFCPEWKEARRKLQEQ